MSSKQSVRIGPDMPDLPMVKATPSPEPGTAPEVGVPERQIVKTEINGLVVETIVSVEQPRVESASEIKARVKQSYTDTHGNLVETY